MLVYQIVFFLVTFFSIVLACIGKNFYILRKLIHFFIILILSSLFVVRDYSIGIDTYSYVKMIDDISIMRGYNELIHYSTSLAIEIGFLTFIYFLRFLENPNFILFFCAILIYYNYSKVVDLLNINPLIFYTSLFTFFGIFFFSFNILRQCIALSFVVLAVSKLNKDDVFGFFVNTILATLFHYSALICFLFYFVFLYSDWLYRFRIFLVIFILSIAKVVFYLLASYYPRYSDYMTMKTAESNLGVFLFSFYFIIYFISEFLLIKKNDKFLKLSSLVLLLYLVLQISFIINNIYNHGATRIVLYFLWPTFVIVCIFFKEIKDINLRSFLIICFYLFLFFYFYVVIMSLDYSFVPFRFSSGYL